MNKWHDYKIGKMELSIFIDSSIRFHSNYGIMLSVNPAYAGRPIAWKLSVGFFSFQMHLTKYHDKYKRTSFAKMLMEDKWWCQTCEEWVSPKDVTHDEMHDVRSGGCGNLVQ